MVKGFFFNGIHIHGAAASIVQGDQFTLFGAANTANTGLPLGEAALLGAQLTKYFRSLTSIVARFPHLSGLNYLLPYSVDPMVLLVVAFYCKTVELDIFTR